MSTLLTEKRVSLLSFSWFLMIERKRLSLITRAFEIRSIVPEAALTLPGMVMLQVSRRCL